MKIRFKIVLSIAVFLFSCKKDVGIESRNILQGQVQFSINNGVTLKQCLDAFKDFGVTEYDLINFYYSKVIPNDSMLYYHNLLKARPYITVFNVFKKTGDAHTRFQSITFKNLNNADFHEWDSIVKKEALIEMPDIGDGNRRRGFIYITPGQEKTWIERLKELSIIHSADYLYFGSPGC
ncbi:MAG: hypothetical protein JNK73_13890 [Bacteroidia bacterium]|nr:hypothetical protein [Bacteroidia bacterium]